MLGTNSHKEKSEENLGANNTGGWFLTMLFRTGFQACTIADHLLGPLLLRQ